jgi:hypothetical protein
MSLKLKENQQLKQNLPQFPLTKMLFMDLWHLKMRHIGLQRLYKLSKLAIVEGMFYIPITTTKHGVFHPESFDYND